MRKISILISVILILVVMLFSSVSVTADIEKNINSNLNYESESINKGPVVWDNRLEFSGFMHAQWDVSKQFDFYIADDFQFDETTEVADIHWIGGYWGKDYQSATFDWCISFYYHNSSTGGPEGSPQSPSFSGPYCFAWSELGIEIINDTGSSIYYKFSVDLEETLIFESNQKYWISIWAEGLFPPQSGWGYHKDYLLNPAVLASSYFGFPFWTPGINVQGFDFDMAFQLTAPLEPLPPTSPFIDGPREGPVDTELCWTFISEDPNEDNIKYVINWGDGTSFETDYNESNEEVELCHTYSKRKVFVITAYAKDENGLVSDNSTFAVTIPRFRGISNILDLLVERFPDTFLFLQNFLKIIL
ncbi:hypothetical protein AYK21_02230 [Thermoplasmatales archaeon SG8-52-2]|nr:MAG: hypothetical protein AYK21_02230 [Thermoplasmatales archaeon SG8-52-2]